MENVADFELLSIDIEEEFFPKNFKIADGNMDNYYKWKFGFELETGSYKEGYSLLTLIVTYDLQNKDDEDIENSIAYLSISDKYKVSSGISNENKVIVLEILLDISAGHIQGIFAAKCPDSFGKHMLPPIISKEILLKQIKQEIKDAWQ